MIGEAALKQIDFAVFVHRRVRIDWIDSVTNEFGKTFQQRVVGVSPHVAALEEPGVVILAPDTAAHTVIDSPICGEEVSTLPSFLFSIKVPQILVVVKHINVIGRCL